jgi:hypothetical protein
MGGRSLPLTGAEVAANGTQSDGENFGQDQPHVTSRRIYGGVPTPKQRIRRGMAAGTEETLHCWGFGLPLVAERKWQWYQGSLDNMRGQIYRTTAKNFFSSELTASSIGFLFFSDFSTFLLCRIL